MKLLGRESHASLKRRSCSVFISFSYLNERIISNPYGSSFGFSQHHHSFKVMVFSVHVNSCQVIDPARGSLLAARTGEPCGCSCCCYWERVLPAGTVFRHHTSLSSNWGTLWLQLLLLLGESSPRWYSIQAPHLSKQQLGNPVIAAAAATGREFSPLVQYSGTTPL